MEAVSINQTAKAAIFSPDGLYRYRLSRKWDEDKPMVMCVGLNPSTANSEQDDATIRKLTEVLRYYGYGGFYMMNLYALISSTPDKLHDCADPLKDNDGHICNVAQYVNEAFLCWGTFKGIEVRTKTIIGYLKANDIRLMCFGKSTKGIPIHPAYYARRGTPASQVPITTY